MIHRLIMKLRGEAWREVARACVERHLTGEGESVDREVVIARWQRGRRVWARVGPGPQERVELARVEGLVAGSGGWRRSFSTPLA